MRYMFSNMEVQMVAMRKEVEDVVTAIGRPPAFNPVPMLNANPVQEFEQLLKEYRRHMMNWRSGILKAIANLEGVFAEARELGDDALRMALDEIMPPIQEAVSASLERAENKVLIDPQTQANLDFAVYAEPKLGPLIRGITRNYLQAANIYLVGLTDVRDRVQMLEWDFDPDARGGKSFDNADDLLASLGA